MHSYCALPRQPREDYLNAPVLVMLLRRLHAMTSFSFPLQFDGKRRGAGVVLADSSGLVTNWRQEGSTIYGDRPCESEAVSYWEATGFSEGSYVGIVEELPRARTNGGHGMSFGAVYHQRLSSLLSLPRPACDYLPALMYCESGFITNGTFRGPKPKLPGGVKFLHAQPYKEADRIGVCVDLMEGRLVFFVNGSPTGMVIPIERHKTYFPIFTAKGSYNLRLLPEACPPWDKIYRLAEDLERSSIDHSLAVKLDDQLVVP